MKKLLLVLLVVTLASFLFVGCLPTTPAEGEGEGEGEVGICPTVSVTSQQVVGGKTYIKGGKQTITVTFAVPTEPVSVYVANTLKSDVFLPLYATEVVVYPNADKTIYEGTVTFASSDEFEECFPAYIYVVTCDTCDACKYPYIVDSEGPETKIEITSKACVCTGCDLTFKSPATSTTCGVATDCCGDYCSGFASYSIDLYTEMPFKDCCAIPCATPKYSCPAGVACPVDCILSCVDNTKDYWVVTTLLDALGNQTRYYSTIEFDTGCGITVKEWEENKTYADGTIKCSDYTVPIRTDTDTVIGICYK